LICVDAQGSKLPPATEYNIMKPVAEAANNNKNKGQWKKKIFDRPVGVFS